MTDTGGGAPSRASLLLAFATLYVIWGRPIWPSGSRS